MSERIRYIGACQHDGCRDDATRWVYAQKVVSAVISDSQTGYEDWGYLCESHAQEARESQWNIIEDKQI